MGSSQVQQSKGIGGKCHQNVPQFDLSISLYNLLSPPILQDACDACVRNPTVSAGDTHAGSGHMAVDFQLGDLYIL